MRTPTVSPADPEKMRKIAEVCGLAPGVWTYYIGPFEEWQTRMWKIVRFTPSMVVIQDMLGRTHRVKLHNLQSRR